VVIPSSPGFSVVRWLCTSRSAWSWLVRALLLGGAAGLAFAAHRVYLAWLADMQRRHALRIARIEAMRAGRPAIGASGATAAAESKEDGEAAGAAGLSAFAALVALISRRYQLLQRYNAVLKHVRFASSSPSLADASVSTVHSLDSPVSPSAPALSPSLQLTAVFDELESALSENVYLKDLLRRMHAQIDWSSAAAEREEEPNGDAVADGTQQRQAQQVQAPPLQSSAAPLPPAASSSSLSPRPLLLPPSP